MNTSIQTSPSVWLAKVRPQRVWLYALICFRIIFKAFYKAIQVVLLEVFKEGNGKPSFGRCQVWSHGEEENKADPVVTCTCCSQYRYGYLGVGCCQERKHMAGRLVEVPAGYSLSRLNQKLLGKKRGARRRKWEMTTAFDGGKFDGFCVWADTVAPASSLFRI